MSNSKQYDLSLIKPVYVVMDVETTGLSRQKDRIVQVACLKIDEHGAKSSWMSYINPCTDRTRQLSGGYKVHHISPDMLLKKPKFGEIANSLWDFLEGVDVIVAYNCLYDWDMLSREFRRLDQSELLASSSKSDHESWVERLNTKFMWVDALRLCILKYPRLPNHKLGTVARNLNIEVKSCTSYSYKSSLNTGEWEGLSVFEQGQDQWQGGAHDAMCDVLTTYEVLRQCLTLDSTQRSIQELITHLPQAVLDTKLFLEMEKLLDLENKAKDKDLVPYSSAAKKYFSTYRPKGRLLGGISKGFLFGCTNSLQVETNRDERIILIYRAAALDEACDQKQTNEEKYHKTIKNNPHPKNAEKDIEIKRSSDLSQIFRQKKPRLS